MAPRPVPHSVPLRSVITRHSGRRWESGASLAAPGLPLTREAAPSPRGLPGAKGMRPQCGLRASLPPFQTWGGGQLQGLGPRSLGASLPHDTPREAGRTEGPTRGAFAGRSPPLRLAGWDVTAPGPLRRGRFGDCRARCWKADPARPASRVAGPQVVGTVTGVRGQCGPRGLAATSGAGHRIGAKGLKDRIKAHRLPLKTSGHFFSFFFLAVKLVRSCNSWHNVILFLVCLGV